MNYFDKHPNIMSIIATIIFFGLMALCVFLGGCKTTRLVEVHTTDTLHVYHTDTLREVHNDTIYSIVTQTVHDSIVKQIIIKEVVNESGDVIHSEKETNNEVWHNSDTNSQLIQHTVDSILQTKLDSISHISHEEKPVIVEVEKPTPWYTKAWNWIVGKFAWIGLIALLVLLLYIFLPKIKNWIK